MTDPLGMVRSTGQLQSQHLPYTTINSA